MMTVALTFLLAPAAALALVMAPPLEICRGWSLLACRRPSRGEAIRLCDGREGEFEQLLPDLPLSVAAKLHEQGVSSPTPIQRAALPRIFDGESLLLHAETGSGKSLAFLLPALARLGIAGVEEECTAEEVPAAKVLVVAPTRELAVQLANEAVPLLPSAGAVQIVAVGATPEPLAMLQASVITCTAPELLELVAQDGSSGAMDSVLSQVRVLVLDELDMLLPVTSIRGPRAAQRKKAESRSELLLPAEELVRLVMEASSASDLQLLAASATVSRPTRLKLARVLRRDPIGRWYDAPPQIVRPTELHAVDLSSVPRAVVIPSEIAHYYAALPSTVKLRRLMPKPASRPVSKRRLTLKQKRAMKLAAQKVTLTLTLIPSPSRATKVEPTPYP